MGLSTRIGSYISRLFSIKEEKKQKLCTNITKEICEDANSQRLITILVVIHHSMVVLMIHFQQRSKKSSKPMEVRDQQESKGKIRNATNSSKAYGNNNQGKVKEKGYKGKAKLSP